MLITEQADQSEKDFSGQDVAERIFAEVDFHESVFNGVYFDLVTFKKCNLKHTEFTEARFARCRFIDCELDYSDFVYAKLEKVNFETCSFGHVEWRETAFTSVRYENCTFYNATVSLCVFKTSTFDKVSTKQLLGNSKNYNVFLKSELSIELEQIAFLRYNYGVESLVDDEILVEGINIDEPFLKLSVLKFTKRLNSLIFIEMIGALVSQIITTLEKNRLQKLKYLNLICKTMADSELLSAFAVHYLITALNSCAREINDSTLFMELVDLIMYLKRVQYNSVVLVEQELAEIEMAYEASSIHIKFHLEETYPIGEVESFLERMSYFLDIPPTDIKLLSYQSGSTIFEIIVNSSTTLAGAFAFINFSLAQLNKTLIQIAKIRKTVRTLREPVKVPGGRFGIAKKAALPSEIMSNEQNPYYNKMNDLLRIFGKDIAKMDGPANVTIKS